MPVLYSDWSASTAVTPAPRSWWLKMPSNPTRNLPVEMRDVAPVSFPAPQQIVAVLGSRYKVVNVDAHATSGTAQGTATVFTETAAQRDAVRALLQSGAVLLLQGPAEGGQPGEHRYVSTSAPTESRIAQKALPWRDTSFDYVEVATP